MILLYILLSILLIVFVLLTIPIRIYVDSDQSIFLLEWKNIIKVNVLLQSDDLLIRLNTFFWKKDYSLLQTSASSKPPEKKKKKQKKTFPSKKWKFNFKKKFKNLLRAIQIKQMNINIDTDDYIWNAYLSPIFYFLRKGKRSFQINYQGNVEILLEIQSRPIRLLYAILF